MIPNSEYSNVTSGRLSSKNTDALYQSFRKDYMDAKAIYDNLVTLRQNAINATSEQSMANHPINAEIATAKSVMDKAKGDWDAYKKSDVYTLGVQNAAQQAEYDRFKTEQLAAAALLEQSKLDMEAQYKDELKESKTLMYIIGGVGALAVVALIVKSIFK